MILKINYMGMKPGIHKETLRKIYEREVTEYKALCNLLTLVQINLDKHSHLKFGTKKSYKSYKSYKSKKLKNSKKSRK